MSTSNNNQASVREAVGIFFDASSLRAAVDDLVNAGFDKAQLGLLAAEDTVEQSLGDLYVRPNETRDSPDAPAIAFVNKESIGDTAHGMGGAMLFVGTTSAGAIAVASTAVFGGALAVAIAAAAGVGAVGAAMSLIIHKSDAEYLEEQVDEGHLLLFVRILDPGTEQRVLDLLARHSAYEPRIHELRPGKKGSAHIVDPAAG